MRHTNHSWNKVGYLLCSAAALAVTGCVTHVHHGPARVVHVPAPPPVVTPVPPAPAVVVIQHERDFYEPLTPYGEWVVLASHGRCWRPARVMAGWRPYADGHWERTDAGWYWVSEEPWAWATYHYGRWDWTQEYGWVWLPQTQWAPAWVAWREGAGYIGWAPLPPSARISVSGVVEIHDLVIAPRFVFVEERRVLERVRPTTVIVNNTTVINKTVNITKIKVVNQIVINEGPRPDKIERASGRKVQTVAVRELRQKHEAEAASRRDARQVKDKEIETTPQTAAEPKKAVMPHVTPAPAPIVEPVKETPAVTAKPQADEKSEPRHARPARPERREPPRAEKKPEVIPAAVPDVKPEPQRAVLPRERKQIEKPAEVAKEAAPVPARSRRDLDEQKSVATPPASSRRVPAAAVPETMETDKRKLQATEKRVEPQPQREVKPSKQKSDAREKATGKPEEKKTRRGAPELTNNPATPPPAR